MAALTRAGSVHVPRDVLTCLFDAVLRSFLFRRSGRFGPHLAVRLAFNVHKALACSIRGALLLACVFGISRVVGFAVGQPDVSRAKYGLVEEASVFEFFEPCIKRS